MGPIRDKDGIVISKHKRLQSTSSRTSESKFCHFSTENTAAIVVNEEMDCGSINQSSLENVCKFFITVSN